MYHYMKNPDYATLVDQLAELGTERGSDIPLTEIVRVLGEQGVIPVHTKPYIEGKVPPLPDVRFIDAPSSTPDPQFVSEYQDMLPKIAEELALFVRDFCTREENAEGAARAFLAHAI